MPIDITFTNFIGKPIFSTLNSVYNHVKLQLISQKNKASKLNLNQF